MSHQQPSRRRFLQTSAALAAGISTAAYWPAGRLSAAPARAKQDRPTIAAIGTGRRGLKIAQDAARHGDLVAVCDVDRAHAEQGKAKAGGGKAKIYGDYRRLLERQDIEAVVIGTPDHWHTPIALAAVRAGKDVYCEKPLTLTVAEGWLLRDAVKQHKAVFQVGTQQRSEYDGMFRMARALVREGRLGKLHTIQVTIPDSTQTGGPFASQPVPTGLDWDMWQGQAPEHEYCPERCHWTFRWWYEYSGGIMTDWGAHHIDVAQWCLGPDGIGPLTIDGKGEMPTIPNGYNTPAAINVDMVYPGDVKLNIAIDAENGVLLEGDQGRIFVNRGKLTGKPVEDLAENPLSDEGMAFAQPQNHMENFFDCIRTRETPNSDVESQHRSVTTCHLANISMRLGRKLTWDATKERFAGDDEANAMLSRPHRRGYEFG